VKRAALVLAFAAGFGALLLVGHGGSKTSAQAAVKRVAANSVDVGSSRFTMSREAPQLPDQVAPVDFEGVMDYVHHRGRIVYSRDTEMLFEGKVTYLKWPMPWRHDAVWLRYEDDVNDVDPLDLRDRATRNPIGLLGFLTGASDDVREVGKDDVRGASTTHYEGTLDLQKVVNQAPPDQRAELQEALTFIAEDEAKTVPFGLWVDSDGVAHRLRLEEPRGVRMTIEYYDFGVPVELTPPPANEIMSTEEFTKEIEKHAGDSSCETSDAGTGGPTPRGGNGVAEYCVRVE
jgi:hypothetical protein